MKDQRLSKTKKIPGAALAALLALSVGQGARAAELGTTWSSVRALGMGDAYTAIVDNGDSLFYNPAGLARVSGFHWTVFDPRAGVNGLEALDAAQGFMGSSDLAASLNSLYGKKVWVGGGAKTALFIPNFAAAAFASTEGGINLHNPAYPTMNLNFFFDYGFAAGFGFDFIPEVVKVGLVGRRVNRTGTTLPIGASTLATLSTTQLEAELKSRGVGYGVDLGIVLTAPGPIKPSVSFVWKNAGGMTFTHDEGAHAPPMIEGDMTVGAAFQIDTPLITISPTVDYKYVNRTDVQLGKKVHIGVEVDLPLIDLRAGLNQGYYTAGLGLGLGPLALDFATYGVELGEYPGQQEDRRYIAQLTFQIGFDPGRFGFGGGGGSGANGSGGERRHLKQRR